MIIKLNNDRIYIINRQQNNIINNSDICKYNYNFYLMYYNKNNMVSFKKFP